MSIAELAPQISPTKEPKAQASSRFAEIDGLRGLAMLLIVIFHAYQYFHDARGQLYDNTWFGSLLLCLDGSIGWFFIVSGFLLYKSIVRQGLTGSGTLTARGFLTRRLLRVMPLYWFAIIVVWSYRTSFLPGDFGDLVEHITLTQVFDNKRIFYTIGPAWFLSVEVMFYFFLAATMTATMKYCGRVESRNHKLLVASAPALFLIVVASVFKLWELLVSHVPANRWTVWFGPLAWADNLGFGMLLAVAWTVANGRVLRPLILVASRIAAGELFIIAVAIRNQSAASVALFHELCMVSFILLLGATVFAPPDSRWRRELARPFLVWVGLISFSLFIWHEPVMLFLSDHGVISAVHSNFWPVCALLLCLSVPIAFASYWTIEFPMTQLRFLFAPGGGLRDYYPEDKPDLSVVDIRSNANPAAQRY